VLNPEGTGAAERLKARKRLEVARAHLRLLLLLLRGEALGSSFPVEMRLRSVGSRRTSQIVTEELHRIPTRAQIQAPNEHWAINQVNRLVKVKTEISREPVDQISAFCYDLVAQ
jgi:hypothetical protein